MKSRLPVRVPVIRHHISCQVLHAVSPEVVLG